jgi:N-acyl-D-aspartate/D-glutamate deacylase
MKLNRKTRWQLRRIAEIRMARRMIQSAHDRVKQCEAIKAPKAIVRMAEKREVFWLVRLSDNIGNTRTPWPRTTPRPRQTPPWKRSAL